MIETALDARATIGESATWVADEGALYWIDVKAPALHRYRPYRDENQSWSLTSDIGGFALTGDGRAVVALRHGLHCLDLESGALDLLAHPPFEPDLFRFNEGACDAAGRFWIGVMFDPLDGSPPSRSENLHSFTFAQGLRREADRAELHNGMAWSEDGKTFFLSHSNRGEIIAFDYNVDGGRLSNRRIFATVPSEDGIPDGAALDTDGGYWSALHGGGKLRRFHPDGAVDRDIALPVSNPTMPAFAGEDLATLYLTSSSDKMGPKALEKEPHAGNVLLMRPGARGIVRHFVVR
jgi:sugar lactone lactonase YvrE